MRQSNTVTVANIFGRIPRHLSLKFEAELFRRRCAGEKLSRAQLLRELLERGLPEVTPDEALKQAVGG
jgi:hypothetical protein